MRDEITKDDEVEINSTENQDEQNDNEEKKKNKDKKDDILLKILSILTAVTIWFIVIAFESPISERKFTSIPVRLENVSVMEQQYGLSIIVEPNISIDVVVSGKKAAINKLRASDIEAYIDFRNVTSSGQHSLPIEVKEIANNISVSEQSVTNTIVPIDKRTLVTLPIEVDIKQYMTDSRVTLTPIIQGIETISVWGPQEIIQTISHAQVNLYLSSYGKIERALTVTENVVLIDRNGDELKLQNIKIDQPTVEVHISVTTEKSVPLELNYKYGYYTDKNTVISISPSEIQVKGSPDYLNSLDRITLGTIDEKTIEDDTLLTMEIPLPDGVTNSSRITTAEVDIKFIDTESRIMTFPTSNLKVVPPSRFEYHITDENLQLKLRGPVANLSYLRQSGIAANIDLSKITEKGTITVPVEVAVMSDRTVFCVGIYMVDVEIY